MANARQEWAEEERAAPRMETIHQEQEAMGAQPLSPQGAEEKETRAQQWAAEMAQKRDAERATGEAWAEEQERLSQEQPPVAQEESTAARMKEASEKEHRAQRWAEEMARKREEERKAGEAWAEEQARLVEEEAVKAEQQRQSQEVKQSIEEERMQGRRMQDAETGRGAEEAGRAETLEERGVRERMEEAQNWADQVPWVLPSWTCHISSHRAHRPRLAQDTLNDFSLAAGRLRGKLGGRWVHARGQVGAC